MWQSTVEAQIAGASIGEVTATENGTSNRDPRLFVCLWYRVLQIDVKVLLVIIQASTL